MSPIEHSAMPILAKFELKGAPELPNKNLYKHWAIKRKNHFKWKLLIHEQCVMAKIAGLGLDSAVLTFMRHSCLEPDFDNLVASFKGCQDGLVYANVITDDRQANVGQPNYKWEFRPRKQGLMTTIQIETREVSGAT